MRPSRYPEAAFLSAMTASATHEVRNVLAIIKESAGLIGDMVGLCSQGKPLNEEKVHRAVARVDTQVRRGADILEGLNRLSHSLDLDLATLDLENEVEQIVALSSRLAKRRRQSLVAMESAGETSVTVHPLHLQMTLFAVIERCIEGFPEGTSLAVRAGHAGGSVCVEFWGEQAGGLNNPFDPAGEDWMTVETLASSVGGTLGLLEEGLGVRISFSSD